MKNLLLPQSEVELVRECISIVNKIIENLDKVQPELYGATSFNRVQALLYLDSLHDLIEGAKNLEYILNLDSVTLEKKLLDSGTTIEEFEMRLMTEMVLDKILK